jgi:hypothetical protein
MSDHDRGPYTPPSERLSFNPREPVRSGGPAPVTLIVSGLILVAIVGGVVLLYKDGFRHKTDAPAIVGAPVNDMRTAAAPDANAVPAGLVIDKTDNATPPASLAATAPPAAAVPAAPPASPIARVPGPPPTAAATHPTAATPAVQPAAASAAATPAKPPKPLTIASLADAAVAHGHAPLRPALAAEPVAAPAGAAWAQIGAFSTAALADKGWNEIAHFDAADMTGKGKQVEPTTHNGAAFYRTIVTGFSSHAAAAAFCDKLKAANKPCITR